MVQFHAKLVTTHISSHNTRAQKVKTQEIWRHGLGGKWKVYVEKFVVVGSMFTPSLIDVV